MVEEEVTGPVLLTIQREYLNSIIGMKSAQIEHLLQKRDELLKTNQPDKKKLADSKDKRREKEVLVAPSEPTTKEPQEKAEQEVIPYMSSNDLNSEVTFCEYRKFDQDDKDCRYVKHHLLPPETGTEDLIIPCHEYKSLEIAHKLDSERLKSKVANEVLRFACGCMNMRTNGTIHFGIMDKNKGLHKHGEIIGIPLKNREDFVDALDYIERCFKDSKQQKDARDCIRNPRFVEVCDKEIVGETMIVEYDVVPKASIVKNKLYSVGLPNFYEKEGKVKCEKKVPYCRVGANTPQIAEEDLVCFIQGLIEKDQQREEAESFRTESSLDFQENQKRKLSVLLTGGKTKMDNSMFYIVVTSQMQPEHLNSITFLVNMKLFCVLDFDPNSEISGLYGSYKEQKAVTPHFLHDYENVKRLDNAAFIENLKLFDRVSWIFCNGRHNFPSGEETVDEKTWIKTRKKQMKKAVTFICNEVLPRSCFVVLFLLTSEVKQPVVEAFHEFYAEMNGHDCLTVIAETKEIYKKWSSLAQVSCAKSSLDEISIVDMPLSHVDATVQSIQLSKNQPARKLPVSNGGLCFLKSVEKAMLDSLEIISVDQCDDANLEVMSNDDVQKIELYFYRGGNIDWINFWLANKNKCGAIIERDAYKEANEIMSEVVSRKMAIRPTESVNIYHNPGSGGSTVARQILWNWRTKLRCAIVKQGKEVTTVCEHMVKLREHEEIDKNKCLPVLVLLEDQNLEYVDDLRRLLTNVITTKKINPSLLCFILLICNRSNDPEKMRRALSSQTIAVTYKLSDEEKPLFEKKLVYLKQKFGDRESKIKSKTVIPKGKSQLSVATQSLSQFEPELKFILTFVLMSNEFQSSYIENVVKNILAKIDHSSQDTWLIRFVALLNTYVIDSSISVSHCEAFLGLACCHNEARFYALEDRLSEEAKLIFIHLRETSTHIQSFRIINSLVAKEILTQLSVNLPQSEIAMKLINDEVLMNHRFGRDEFLKVIRTLFIRRYKVSRGDPENTTFSPLIEHVTTENGGLQRAVDLMKAAFLALGKDSFVAQQLARLLYKSLRFEEAQQWAEEAKSLSPNDTFVLDTLGQVYKWWFNHLCDTLEEKEPSPERVVEIIAIALKAIAAFRDSEKTQRKETVSLNNSYYGEVDVGCKLLKFLSSVTIFSNTNGNSEFLQYLLTEYIPTEVKTPWKNFHHQLKSLQKNLHQALECLSLDLSYFQTDINEEEEELDARDPEQVYKPREWLTRMSVVYAGFFCCIPEENEETNESNGNKAEPPAEKLSPFQRQLLTYKFGGGNVTAILSLFYDKKAERAGKQLEKIMALYPENLTLQKLDKTELTNFLFCQIALNCIQPGSIKILPIEKLKDLSKRFRTKGNEMSPASSLFLLSLLFWPEDSSELSSADEQILLSAIDTLQKLCEQKTQKMSQRKSRIATHFFLGKARGLNKIVHRRVIEKGIKGNLSERKLKWLGGEVWKTKEVVQQLKRIEGWTENENLYMKCGKSDKKIRVIPRYSASLPYGNERVTFYLGFSFEGVLAHDVKIKE
uniref:Sterile alpha motif domain-containing protein 9-like n=1 Tax=Oryzias sinensis TaxID=183150 RepID=A0A8C7YLL4_9TELE